MPTRGNKDPLEMQIIFDNRVCGLTVLLDRLSAEDSMFGGHTHMVIYGT